ncbi:MAG: hypothetical protein ACW99A_00425, partial [Candidatus Kariarchaeaceae archaeon]
MNKILLVHNNIVQYMYEWINQKYPNKFEKIKPITVSESISKKTESNDMLPDYVSTLQKFLQKQSLENPLLHSKSIQNKIHPTIILDKNASQLVIYADEFISHLYTDDKFSNFESDIIRLRKLSRSNNLTTPECCLLIALINIRLIRALLSDLK